VRPPLTAFVLVLALLGSSLSACGGSTGSPSASASVGAEQKASLAYVVDGDTLRVRLRSGDLAYVRLIGIDTPEDVKPDYPVECGARAAAASMRSLVHEGAPLTLRRDSVASPTDRYGRILAHVFAGGRQLELEQLRRGWAYLYRFEGQRFDGLARFGRAQRAARREHRGVWGLCGGDFHSAEPGIQN
jgi:micrococcal nuclease